MGARIRWDYGAAHPACNFLQDKDFDANTMGSDILGLYRYQVGGSDGWATAQLTHGYSTGKYVYGVRADSGDATPTVMVGLCPQKLDKYSDFFNIQGAFAYYYNGSIYAPRENASSPETGYATSVDALDIALIAVDFDNNKVYFGHDNESSGTVVWQNSADPAAGTGYYQEIYDTGLLKEKLYYPSVAVYEQKTTADVVWPLLTNSDLSSYLPTGFKAWADGTATLNLALTGSGSTSLTGLRYMYYSESDSFNMAWNVREPAVYGSGATTNANGVFSVTSLVGPGCQDGQTGYIFIDNGTNKAAGRIVTNEPQELVWGPY